MNSPTSSSCSSFPFPLSCQQNVDISNFEELVGQLAPPRQEDVVEGDARSKSESVVMDTIPIFGRILGGSLSGRSGGSFEFLDTSVEDRRGSEGLSHAFA